MEYPSLEMLKSQLAKALSSLEEDRWDQMTSRGPFQPKNTLFWEQGIARHVNSQQT